MFVPKFHHSLGARAESLWAPFLLQGRPCVVAAGQGLLHFVSQEKTTTAELLPGCIWVQRGWQPDTIALSSSHLVKLLRPSQNKELGKIEMEQGVKQIKMCQLGTQWMLFVIGEGFVSGLDQELKQRFYEPVPEQVAVVGTVTLGKIAHIAVGTAQREIKIFGENRLVCSIGVGSSVTALCELGDRWVYGCEDGTVVVMSQRKEVNRRKGKSRVRGLSKVQLKKGPLCFLVWREDNNLELRDSAGKNMEKVKIGGGVQSLLEYDFRGESSFTLCVFTFEGVLKAFSLELKEQPKEQDKKLLPAEKIDILERHAKTAARRRQLQAKLAEIRGLVKEAGETTEPREQQPNLREMLTFSPQLCLQFQCNWLIRSITFTVPIEPRLYVEEQRKVRVPIKAQNLPGIFQCRVVVCSSSFQNSLSHIFTKEIRLCKYFEWRAAKGKQIAMPESRTEFSFKQKMPRYVNWLRELFYLQLTTAELERVEDQDRHTFRFVRADSQTLAIQIDVSNSLVVIHCNLIELAGALIQDLCDYANCKDLQSVAQFPQLQKSLRANFDVILAAKRERQNVGAEIADAITRVNGWLANADENRGAGQLGEMNKCYQEILNENKAICQELRRKQASQDALKEALKGLSLGLGHYCDLRVGRARQGLATRLKGLLKENQVGEFLLCCERGE